MKTIYTILVLLLVSKFGFSQVGINTTTPDAVLDIKSSNQATPANNDGVLIPKIDAFPVTNPTAAQNSMMVYLTVDLPGKPKGFYYWDNGSTSWIGFNASNWTKTGNNIANNNTGNVGIGTGATAPSSLFTVKQDGIGFTQENGTGTSQVGFYTSAASAWLQTHSNTDLSFATNNAATQMVLQKGTGNVGIGIAVPTEKLEVAGKTKTTNLQVTTGATIGNVLTSDALGNATWQAPIAPTAWSLTGNAGTSFATNFIGTTDNIDFIFKRNNIKSGIISLGSTSFGNETLSNNTAFSNSAFGDRALTDNTSGSSNSAFGWLTLNRNTQGSQNAGFGSEVLMLNTLGNNNTGIGYRALEANTIGSDNTAAGNAAMLFNTTANKNVALGARALLTQYFTNGGVAYDTNNIAIGYEALFNNNPTGTFNAKNNVALGNYSLRSNSIGYSNISLGSNSLEFNSSASNNIAIGVNALNNNNFSNGGIVYNTNNIAIGSDALRSNNPTSITNGNNNVAIGYATLDMNSIGNNNTGIGTVSLRSNSTGTNNTGIGANTLFYNSIGSNNTALGKDALLNNIKGSNATAIGYAAMKNVNTQLTPFTSENVALGYEAYKGSATTSSNTGNFNTALGYQVLQNNSTAERNTGVGNKALYSNSTGNNNTASGYKALASNTTGSSNTATGSEALYQNTTGVANLAYGSSALYNNTSGYRNLAIGSSSLYDNTSGTYNLAIGSGSLGGNGNLNVAIGDESMRDNITGYQNTTIGFQSMEGINNGGYNTSVGCQSLLFNKDGNYNSAYGSRSLINIQGSENTAIGVNTMTTATSGNYNTVIGTNSLYTSSGSSTNTTLGHSTLFSNISGSGNIALGYQAGYNELGSNRLYIENSNSATPLIYGEFDNDLARINGNFRVNSTTNGGDEMQVKNSNIYVHPTDANLNFGSGGGSFMVSTQDNSAGNETGGIYGDGNAVTVWSPGDSNGGQPAALIYFVDEDFWGDNNGNPYDGTSVPTTALKSYISPAGAYVQISDKNKKENIVKIENALEKVTQINGYTYQFKLAPSEIEKGDKPIKSSGVLAQEIEKVLPEAVQKSEKGDYFVDYAAITPLLIEAIKTQNEKIKTLETTNSEILKRLEKLENK